MYYEVIYATLIADLRSDDTVGLGNKRAFAAQLRHPAGFMVPCRLPLNFSLRLFARLFMIRRILRLQLSLDENVRLLTVE